MALAEHKPTHTRITATESSEDLRLPSCEGELPIRSLRIPEGLSVGYTRKTTVVTALLRRLLDGEIESLNVSLRTGRSIDYVVSREADGRLKSLAPALDNHSDLTDLEFCELCAVHSLLYAHLLPVLVNGLHAHLWVSRSGSESGPRQGIFAVQFGYQRDYCDESSYWEQMSTHG